MVLRDNGHVAAYNHENERYWLVDERFLRFLNDSGQVTSILRRYPLASSFIDDGRSGLRLIPVLDLGDVPIGEHTVRIIVNTIPKSGTYLVAAVLGRLGLHDLGLHLGDIELHDNRAIQMDRIHWNPAERRLECPASAVAAAMAAGEYVVGHLCNAREALAIEYTGVHIIQCVRDLRDVLASLWNFKRTKVKPLSAADELWRRLDGPAGFLGFLIHFAERDVASILAGARGIAEGSGLTLKFEDLVASALPNAARDGLELIETGLGGAFIDMLPKVLGTPTSTLSEVRANHLTVWSAAAQEFFENSGLAEVNAALGYPAR